MSMLFDIDQKVDGNVALNDIPIMEQACTRRRLYCGTTTGNAFNFSVAQYRKLN